MFHVYKVVSLCVIGFGKYGTVYIMASYIEVYARHEKDTCRVLTDDYV